MFLHPEGNSLCLLRFTIPIAPLTLLLRKKYKKKKKLKAYKFLFVCFNSISTNFKRISHEIKHIWLSWWGQSAVLVFHHEATKHWENFSALTLKTKIFALFTRVQIWSSGASLHPEVSELTIHFLQKSQIHRCFQ